jgi:Ca2+-binding EF-hand superfamily protein
MKVIVILAAGLALSVAVLAQEKLGPELNSTDLLRRIDADHDGFVTRDEWNRFFADHDENKDGLLARQELGVQEPQERQPFPPDPAIDELFARLDQDKDGMVSQSEWTGSKRQFQRADADRDGRLSREEFRSPNARFWNQLFEDLDTNGDHIITRTEWLDTEEAFRRLDRDRDGVITGREFYKLW